MDPQQQYLFNLMSVVKESQESMDVAIEGLAKERAALFQERTALARERAAVAQVATHLAGISDEVRKAATEAVGVMVLKATQDASTVAARALSGAARPVIDELAGAVQSVSTAEDSMRRASSWFAWKWITLAGAGTAGVCLVMLTAVWGLGQQVKDLRVERDEMQATVDLLQRKGGRASRTECGGRPCFEISPNQGTKQGNEWRGAKGERFVILQGY